MPPMISHCVRCKGEVAWDDVFCHACGRFIDRSRWGQRPWQQRAIVVSGLPAILLFVILSSSLRGNMRLPVAAFASMWLAGMSLLSYWLRKGKEYRPRRIMHEDAWQVVLYMFLCIFIAFRAQGSYVGVQRNTPLAFSIEELPAVEAVLKSDFGTPEDGYKPVTEWLRIATDRGGGVKWGIGERGAGELVVEAVVRKPGLPPLVLRWGMFERRKKPWFTQMEFGGRTVRYKGQVIQQLRAFQRLVEWPGVSQQ